MPYKRAVEPGEQETETDDTEGLIARSGRIPAVDGSEAKDDTEGNKKNFR